MTQRLYARQEWGARYRDGFDDRPLPFTEFWLHHAAGDYAGRAATLDQDKAGVRRLEDIGESRFGGGISYTFPVARSGRIFTGHSIDRRGAHTKGHNTVGSAFCLMQDCRDTAVNADQHLAIAQRMVIEHRAHRATRHTLNGGHTEASGNATSCPERLGLEAVAPINLLADQLWAAGYPNTTPEVGTMADADAQRVIDHVNKLALYGYTTGGKDYPGMAWVNIENQVRLDALTQAVATLAENLGMGPVDIAGLVDAAVRDRLERIEVHVSDVQEDAPPAPPAEGDA